MCFILTGEELRYMKKWKIASSLVSMGILRNTTDVSLAPYHYHVILRYLRIQSLDLADIRSHPILYVYVTCKYQTIWTKKREKVETSLSL